MPPFSSPLRKERTDQAIEFSKEQIIYALGQAYAETRLIELCRQCSGSVREYVHDALRDYEVRRYSTTFKCEADLSICCLVQ